LASQQKKKERGKKKERKKKIQTEHFRTNAPVAAGLVRDNQGTAVGVSQSTNNAICIEKESSIEKNN
jgi:hypothetical protein